MMPHSSPAHIHIHNSSHTFQTLHTSSRMNQHVFGPPGKTASSGNAVTEFMVSMRVMLTYLTFATTSRCPAGQKSGVSGGPAVRVTTIRPFFGTGRAVSAPIAAVVTLLDAAGWLPPLLQHMNVASALAISVYETFVPPSPLSSSLTESVPAESTEEDTEWKNGATASTAAIKRAR